jgi:hypothetical protein
LALSDQRKQSYVEKHPKKLSINSAPQLTISEVQIVHPTALSALAAFVLTLGAKRAIWVPIMYSYI